MNVIGKPRLTIDVSNRGDDDDDENDDDGDKESQYRNDWKFSMHFYL